MNEVSQMESQIQHIFRMYEDNEVQFKLLELCIEWYEKGMKKGVQTVSKILKENAE